MTVSAAPAPRLSRIERREYLAGVSAAAVLILILVFTALANRAKVESGAGAFTLTAEFHRADGVHVGSPVRVAGVNIGTVSAATLANDDHAVLTLTLTHPVPLPDDTAAVIETDGIFGAKYIELRPGGTEDMLKSGGRIGFSQDSVIIEDLIALIVQRAKDARAGMPWVQPSPLEPGGALAATPPTSATPSPATSSPASAPAAPKSGPPAPMASGAHP